ncbi:MAG: hypothetical protein PVI50_02690 [Gammaproteobacteria bacterium]|jgi:hypothetical protein
MNTPSLVCWHCGTSLEAQPLPLARVAECAACQADLHVCRLCEFYDTRVAKACREPVAEVVTDKTRANFCDYFQPHPGAYVAPDAVPAQQARRELGALFGEADESAAGDDAGADEARRRLDDLFGLD